MTIQHSDGRIFEIAVRVYYEDTDFSGIVYHANYLKFFERGRSDALRDCGVHHSELLERAEPLAFVIRKMTIDWRAPAKIDDMLQVRTRFDRVAGARLFISQETRRGETLLVAAEVEAACVSLTGRARRLPSEVLAKLGDSSWGNQA
ncbi:MAG: tol-pal system-associated acyl-CoA thioesterase [Pseudomonadota bacterium]